MKARLQKSFRQTAVALVWLLFFAGQASGAEQASSPLLDSLYTGSGEDAERVILVLHRGRPGNEMASGSRLTMYRPRSYNPDLTWNQRIARTLAERHGLSYLTDWWMSEIDVNCAVLQIPGDADVNDVLAELLEDPEVVTAHQLSVFTTLGGEPNDPYFHLQSSARYFDLTEMHLRATGKDVLIAIVDTGIETEHQDLDGQIRLSRNFVEQVSPGFAEDMHGTAVAGVIAARANNEAGIVGMAPDAKLLGLKACWPVESGKLAAVCNSFTLALAINQAVVENASIINLSLAGPPDGILEMLIEAALQKGIVVVAATRNNDSLASSSFPASIPGVIAVTDSDYQTPRVAGQPVFAPSEDIFTTLPENQYNFVSGTSLGAAQVAGYIALLLQENPHLSIPLIHDRLIEINNREAGEIRP